MRRPFVLVIALLAVAIGVYFVVFKKDKKGDDRPKDQPLAIAENTGSFNESFDRLLTAYFNVKDALVASDTMKVNAAAASLIIAADSLKTSEIQADTAIKATAADYAATISGSAKGVLGEKDIEEKRKDFEVITESVWTLTRTVKYAGKKVYYQYCPMAFDNKGAYWMSLEREIKNPYFGEKMLECGSVEDSLDYSKN